MERIKVKRQPHQLSFVLLFEYLNLTLLSWKFQKFFLFVYVECSLCTLLYIQNRLSLPNLFALFVVLLWIHYCTCTLLRRNGYIYIRVFAERYFVYIDYCWLRSFRPLAWLAASFHQVDFLGFVISFAVFYNKSKNSSRLSKTRIFFFKSAGHHTFEYIAA